MAACLNEAPYGGGRRHDEPSPARVPKSEAQTYALDSTAAGVAIAVGSFITLYGLSQSVEQNVGQSIEEHGADLTVRRTGTAELFGGTIPETIGPRIAEIPGVAAVSGEMLSLVGTDRDEHVLTAGWAARELLLAECSARRGATAKSR